MRIGIDASNLRAGGGITHLVELLRAANPQVHGFDQVIVWAGSVTLAKLEERGWLRKEHDSLLERPLPYRIYWQRYKLAELARAAGCDVLFVPGGPDASGFRPIITMSRNLLPFEWREMRRYGFSWTTLRLLLLHFTQTRTFRRADGLIFLTQYAQGVVMKSVGKNGGKLTVIPHGIDQRFSCPPRAQHEISEFTTDNPFRLLYVSIVNVYKHQWHVAEAVAQLRASGFPVILDLMGPAYAPALARLNETLQRVDPESRFIRYRGAVPYEELHGLYAAADINVFASSCENMPNILLEGMASGLPIACSNRGPMPEILGDFGVYFDPEQPDEIAQALRNLLEDPDLRTRYASGVYKKAKTYSWERCANETFSFINQVAKKFRHI